MAALSRLGPALSRLGPVLSRAVPLPSRRPGAMPGWPRSPGGAPVAPGTVPVRAMAGHNRWSKVRHVKAPRDAERSRERQRLTRMLRAAAAEGGAEASLNPALAALLERCRSQNVPKATIEGALRSARERPAGGSRLLLTARGPGGALLLLDVRTDNVRRTRDELRTLLGRHGAALTADVRHAFEAVGVVRVSGRTLPMEAALEAAVVAGAQDVVAEGQDEVKFLCAPPSLATVRQSLVAAGLRPLSATVEFRPRSALTPPAGARAAAERLLGALAGRPDIAGLYHNLQQGSEVTPGGHSAPDTTHSGHSAPDTTHGGHSAPDTTSSGHLAPATAPATAPSGHSALEVTPGGHSAPATTHSGHSAPASAPATSSSGHSAPASAPATTSSGHSALDTTPSGHSSPATLSGGHSGPDTTSSGHSAPDTTSSGHSALDTLPSGHSALATPPSGQ
nr:translational activator of cytochrome c oxidase 1 [Taeniopygia guttata]